MKKHLSEWLADYGDIIGSAVFIVVMIALVKLVAWLI